MVNASGGIDGRKVQLKIVDDASSPDQVITNYQNLITKDNVDLVFGPFSTLLSAPAAKTANRYGYAFIEPAGGGPAIFEEKLQTLLRAAGAGREQRAGVRQLHPVAAGRPAAEDGGVPRARRPVRGADRGDGPGEVRGRRHQDRVQGRSTRRRPPTSRRSCRRWRRPTPTSSSAGPRPTTGSPSPQGHGEQNFSPKFLFMANGPARPEFPDKVGRANLPVMVEARLVRRVDELLQRDVGHRPHRGPRPAGRTRGAA